MANNGIVANTNKFQFCWGTVDLAGLTVTSTGVALSQKILATIQNFPRLPDITAALLWFGLINQISWAYGISPTMQPFRDLIKPDVKFYFFFFFLIGIYFMQGYTATTRHGVTRKRNTERLKHTGNLFRKILQSKDVC